MTCIDKYMIRLVSVLLARWLLPVSSALGQTYRVTEMNTEQLKALEPVPRGAPPAPSRAPPTAENAIVLRLACGDVCLLNENETESSRDRHALFLSS